VLQQVNKTLDEFAVAVGRRDADAIAALHVEGSDALAIWPGEGEEIAGSEAIRAALRQEMSAWKAVTFTITDRQVRVMGPESAFVWGHYDEDLDASPPGTPHPVLRRVRGGRFFAVMARRPEGWRMLIEGGSIPLNAAMYGALLFPPSFPTPKPKP
jgi:ketosteroid isomerase-like protein